MKTVHRNIQLFFYLGNDLKLYNKNVLNIFYISFTYLSNILHEPCNSTI